MHSTTARFGRRAFGLAALGALALSACGSDEVARFAGGGSDEEEAGTSDGGGAAPDAVAPDLPQLEPGMIVEDFTKDVTVSDTLQPTRSTVITPTGTLSIDGIQEIASVPAEAVDLEPEMDEDGEVQDFAAADGEGLRAIDLSFTANSQDPYATDGGLPTTDISIRAGGSQTHLAEIDADYSSRYLLSVPADGSALLVVSSDGHDQLVDLLTGERQEDDIAAAYYREGRVQEPHHTFPVEVEPMQVLYSGDADSEITAGISFQATTLTLAAWTEKNGWAEPGSAWLSMDWSSEATVSTEVPGLVKVKEYSAVASVTVGEDTTSDELHSDRFLLNPSSNKDQRTLVTAVPVETTSVTVSMRGGFSVEFDGSSGSYELSGAADREYTSDELAVEFPPGGAASGAQPSDGGGS